jgi:hypothetical protein
MFDFHLGAQLRVPSVKFQDGFFLTGNAGQGKSILLEQIVLDLIKNRQTGLLVDLYGDLAKEVKSHLKTAEAQKQVAFTTLDTSQKDLTDALKSKFVVASGRLMKEGGRKTIGEGQKLLTRFFKLAKPGQWLIVDEALSLATDELLERYLGFKEMGLQTVFAASDFFLLSEEERARFAKVVKNLVIYKPRNINSVLMAKEWKGLDPENIKAIKQYHFQLMLDGKLSYHAAVFPIESI